MDVRRPFTEGIQQGFVDKLNHRRFVGFLRAAVFLNGFFFEVQVCQAFFFQAGHDFIAGLKSVTDGRFQGVLLHKNRADRQVGVKANVAQCLGVAQEQG